ncbi:hypothetical protein [Erythrobacter sp. CCH5-A1]|jgi:hypothetical protein|uniref:hypothetical protein n=1 Tax=Erythrobacter sp. CCH5-A1 TaxID=1768792 RepID=UPI0012E3FA0A|nr:hypothetical protein [Erythrobacter sp. CCH5-A1]
MSCILDDLWQFSDRDFADLVDPRDVVLAELDYSHPDPIGVASIMGAAFFLPIGIDQLAVAELISQGLVREDTDGALSLTEDGCDHVRSRMLKRATWSDYAIRPDARPYSPMGRRLALAIMSHMRDKPDDYFTPMFKELGDLIPGLYKDDRGFWVFEADAKFRADH